MEKRAVTRWTKRRAIVASLLLLIFVGMFVGGLVVDWGESDAGQALMSIGLVGMVFAPLFCSPERGLLE